MDFSAPEAKADDPPRPPQNSPDAKRHYKISEHPDYHRLADLAAQWAGYRLSLGWTIRMLNEALESAGWEPRQIKRTVMPHAVAIQEEDRRKNGTRTRAQILQAAQRALELAESKEDAKGMVSALQLLAGLQGQSPQQIAAREGQRRRIIQSTLADGTWREHAEDALSGLLEHGADVETIAKLASVVKEQHAATGEALTVDDIRRMLGDIEAARADGLIGNDDE